MPNRELLQASMLFSKKHFPIFVFSPISHAEIHISSESELGYESLIAKVVHIIDGNDKIPLLYDVYKTPQANDALKIIETTRKEKEYIDLFHSWQIPFPDLVNLLSKSFEFSEFDTDPISVESYFRLLLNCPRHIHIALHYFINAARLMRSYFTEDAAINLNLASEAIIRDYLNITGLKNKKKAIEQLLLEDLGFGEEKVDWYIELYEARNAFLAHIDEDMFTATQNISDPDAYCYDHYEDVANLIVGYINLNQSRSSTT